MENYIFVQLVVCVKRVKEAVVGSDSPPYHNSQSNATFMKQGRVAA